MNQVYVFSLVNKTSFRFMEYSDFTVLTLPVTFVFLGLPVNYLLINVTNQCKKSRIYMNLELYHTINDVRLLSKLSNFVVSFLFPRVESHKVIFSHETFKTQILVNLRLELNEMNILNFK